MQKLDKTLLKDLNLLYVEDDLMTLDEISFFLKKYVKKLFTAKNGQEGFEIFQNNKIDIILTDIQMPVMNGLEMSEKILDLNPEIPIIITTAYSDANYIMQAIELKIDKYIIKPINLQEILQIMQKAINQQYLLKRNVYFNNYVRFILESNPTFMLVLKEEKIEYVSDRFLELIGEDRISSSSLNLENCNKFFELVDEVQENWIEHVKVNDFKTHLVKLKEPKSEIVSNLSFYVRYKEFKEINKSVLILIDSNEQKFKDINLITKAILNTKKYDDDDFYIHLKRIEELSNPNIN